MIPRTKCPGPAEVRSTIARLALAGTISLEAAASDLRTSPRTLQRRLKEYGLNFWALVDQGRFEITGALLRETDMRVQEIAAGIGYSTPSGFTRAFTRWAGRSPSAYRSALSGQNCGRREWREMGRHGQRQAVPPEGFADMAEES